MSREPVPPDAPRTVRYVLLVAIVLLGVGFMALGIWQIERRAWKVALIQRVEARVHAAPTEAPERARWAGVNAADDEYRHVRAVGHFLDDRATFVRALTDYGGGYWALVPLRLESGDVVLVNRGYVPRTEPKTAAAPAENVVVTGLLRITEPHGTRLQHNDPSTGRWYSRDVEAIARARGLQRVAPYFIDADAGQRSGDAPIGGLTVIAFRNDHLLYAITWFVLALLCGVAVWKLRSARV